MIPLVLVKNRELALCKYNHLSGSDSERAVIVRHSPKVEKIIEIRNLKSTQDFKSKDYRALYEHCFPNPDEQSPWSEMMSTVPDMARIDSDREDATSLRKKYGSLRYHDVVAVHYKRVVGLTSFVTMPLGDADSAVVYNLYSGVADAVFMKNQYDERGNSFRRNGWETRFMLLRHGMAEEDAQTLGYAKNVAGTIMDVEFIGQANDAQSIIETKTRLEIYQHLGALALMLDTGSNNWITPCFQPALADDSNPLLTHLLFRERVIDTYRLGSVSEIDLNLAKNLALARASNYTWQSAPEEIAAMQNFINTRFTAANRAILVPVERLPNITKLAEMDDQLKEQAIRDYGSLDKHAQKIQDALGTR